MLISLFNSKHFLLALSKVNFSVLRIYSDRRDTENKISKVTSDPLLIQKACDISCGHIKFLKSFHLACAVVLVLKPCVTALCTDW